MVQFIVCAYFFAYSFLSLRVHGTSLWCQCFWQTYGRERVSILWINAPKGSLAQKFSHRHILVIACVILNMCALLKTSNYSTCSVLYVRQFWVFKSQGVYGIIKRIVCCTVYVSIYGCETFDGDTIINKICVYVF